VNFLNIPQQVANEALHAVVKCIPFNIPDQAMQTPRYAREHMHGKSGITLYFAYHGLLADGEKQCVDQRLRIQDARHVEKHHGFCKTLTRANEFNNFFVSGGRGYIKFDLTQYNRVKRVAGFAYMKNHLTPGESPKVATLG
jgi:hypothetical protein